MQDKPEDKSKLRRESLQLQRLARMVDVVYAIFIWRVFTLLPQPTAEQLSWEHIGSFLSANIGDFLWLVIGIVVAIIHCRIMFCLGICNPLIVAYDLAIRTFFSADISLSMRLGIELGGSNGTRLFESMAVAMVGISGGWGWSYVIKNHRLLFPEVTEQYAYQLRDRFLAEPITACFTVPFAFVGPVLWEISWLSYPLVVLLVKRRRRAKKG